MRELPKESQPPFLWSGHWLDDPSFLRNLESYIYLVTPPDRVVITVKIAMVSIHPVHR